MATKVDCEYTLLHFRMSRIKANATIPLRPDPCSFLPLKRNDSSNQINHSATFRVSLPLITYRICLIRWECLIAASGLRLQSEVTVDVHGAEHVAVELA